MHYAVPGNVEIQIYNAEKTKAREKEANYMKMSL